MLKKTITYPDFDGVQHTEEFYFNLNQAELAEMALSRRGGLDEYLKEIVASEDGAAVISVFKEMISKSIGKLDPQNKRRFIKSQEIIDDFMQTEAYSALFMELVTNTSAAVEFVRGIVPVDVAGKVDEIALPNDDKEYTDNELLEMSDAEFARVAGKNTKDMSRHHLMIAFERKSHKIAS